MKFLSASILTAALLLLASSPLFAQSDIDYGVSSFTVSGAVSGSFSGTADYESADNFGVNSFEISMNDRNPQTFSLQIARHDSESVEVPVAGTYVIGNAEGAGASFSAIFTDTSEGFSHAAEYTTLFDDAVGELVIEVSENGRLSGFFRFTATDLETGEKVEVTDGTFSAVERMN